MCFIVIAGPGGRRAGPNHCCNQMLAGFLFGATAGYCDCVGSIGLAQTISVLLFILTVLDHLCIIMVPWGYHGPGFERGRFRRGITFGKLLWEIVAFFINNCCLYLSFIFWYMVFSGKEMK